MPTHDSLTIYLLFTCLSPFLFAIYLSGSYLKKAPVVASKRTHILSLYLLVLLFFIISCYSLSYLTPCLPTETHTISHFVYTLRHTKTSSHTPFVNLNVPPSVRSSTLFLSLPHNFDLHTQHIGRVHQDYHTLPRFDYPTHSLPTPPTAVKYTHELSQRPSYALPRFFILHHALAHSGPSARREKQHKRLATA